MSAGISAKAPSSDSPNEEQAPINRKLNEIRAAISSLEQQIMYLRDAIDPVLSADMYGEAGEKEDSTRASQDSPLYIGLDNEGDRILKMVQALSELRDRVQL